MEPKAVLPHLSWSGPQPHDEMESYALAILVRLAETGCHGARNPAIPPCSFTIKTLKVVGMIWSYCRKRIREDSIRDYRSVLLMIKETEKMDMKAWCEAHEPEAKQAVADLLEYVETEKTEGFRVYG
jgi:hypothetical protein